MKNHFLFTLVVFMLSSSVTICMANNRDNSHPNKQQSEIPSFKKKSSVQPFVLPAIDEDIQVEELGLKVTLYKVIFNGQTVFTDEVLQNLVQPYLDKPIDVAELEALRFKITQYYIQQGYVNSGALIPQQTLKDGVLKVDIIEGRLTEINMEGQGWLHPDYIRARLFMDQPFNVKALQENFLLLLNDPLIQNLNANYKPLAKTGQSALDLKVTRARPYQVAVHYNNYNPPSIGSEQIQVEGWVRNLTRWGDKLDFRYDGSEGADSFSGGIAIPLTAQGTLFDFHFNVGRSSIIEEPLAEEGIQSEVQNFSWSLSHPVYRDTQQTLVLGTGFSTRRSQSLVFNEPFSFSNGEVDGLSKVSVLRFFQEYMARYETHVLAFRSTFNVGIDAFNPTIHSNENTPDSEFFSWLGQLQYAYKVNEQGMQIRLRSSLQLSDQTLLSQERMSIGGVYSVRGYRENELVRDNGYSGSLELHYPLFSMSGHFANSLTLVPFMDYGLGWNYGDQTDELHSVGIGLNWEAFGHIKAEIYYAHDLITASNKSEHNLQDEGVHFNVTLFAF